MPSEHCPKLSILTPSFNQADYIEQNIHSVMAQDYPSVEHIIIDGGSNDSTAEILRKFPHLKWVSEKDDGQADALNKGLRMATGDIVGWINSDDYYEDGIFKSVIKHFQDADIQWVIGNLTCVFEGTKKFVSDKSPLVTFQKLLKNPDIVRQPPTFFRKELLLGAGGWDPSRFMTMDFDLWVRLAKITPPKMVDSQWAYFRFHNAQKTSSENLRRQKNELIEIMRQEHASFMPMLRLRLKKQVLMTKCWLKDRMINLGILSEDYRSRPIRLPQS